MRSISPDGLARREAQSQDIVWLLSLSAEGWNWTGATQAVSLDGIQYPARLAAIEQWREELPGGAEPGGLAKTRAAVRVLDCTDEEGSLHRQLEITPPIGILATLRLAWRGQQPLSGPDTAVLLEGRVAEWRIDPLGIRLTLIDELQVQSTRRIGRLLRSSMIPRASSPSLGRTLPWIFGRVEDVELLPYLIGAEGRLAQAITPTDRIIPLDSVDGFPAIGRAQIGAEFIIYTTIDHTAKTLGSLQLPAIRGNAPPNTYPQNTAVRLIPPSGLKWIVADHPCATVEVVRGDGLLVDKALWKSAPAQIGDFQGQVLSMGQWPLNEAGRPVERVSATVCGLTDQAGNLIENPADVIQCLLTHERLGALPASRLDSGAFGQVREALAQRGYRFARRLTGTETLGELLDSAAREAGLWVSGTSPLRPIIADPTPHAWNISESLDCGRAFKPLSQALVKSPEGFIPPDAVELVGAPRRQGLGSPTYQFPTESTASGAIPKHFAMRWLALDGSPAADDLGELIWAHLGEAPFIYEQDYPIGEALLFSGETVCLTDPSVNLEETLAWVMAVETRDGAKARLTLCGPWAGDYCWRQDLTSYIRRFAFGRQVVFVFNGRPVARLSRQGTLRLGGGLDEEATLTGGPFPGPVAIAGGWFYLNYLSAGAYRPFMRLDGAGNAELAGKLLERTSRAMDPQGQSLGSENGRFWLSPDTVSGAFEYVAAERLLHLKGIAIESVRL